MAKRSDRLRTARLPDRRSQLAGFVVGLATGLVVALLAPTWQTEETGIEPGELVIMMDRDQSVGEQRKVLINEWQELIQESQQDLPAAERTTVKIIEVPATATAAHSQLVATAQQGGDDVDVYSLDITWIAEFAEQRWLAPLDRSIVDEAAFLQAPLAAGIYDGSLWALPFNTDAPLLYYRKDLVGKPETWEDIETAWRQQSEADELLTAGYAGQLADYEGFTVNLLEAVLAHDPQALTGERWLQGGSGWAAALERLAGGLASDSPLIHRDSLQYDEIGSLEAFRSREVLFMRNWPVAYRRLTCVEEHACDQPAGSGWVEPAQVGVTTLPALDEESAPGVAVLGGQSLAVASGSDKPRAARSLIGFLTSPRSQEKLFVEGGFVPTQKVVYGDLIADEQFAYLADVLAAVEQAQPRPVHPRYELISETIRRVLRPYLADAELPDPNPLVQQLADELAGARDGFRR